MRGVNKVILVENFGRDPETKTSFQMGLVDPVFIATSGLTDKYR